MYDRPEAWLDAVRRSHTAVETAQVLDGDDQPMRGADGVELPALKITSGEITEDAGAEVRHTGQLTIVDATGDLTPREMTDLLAPVGRRVRVRRGIEGFPDDDITLGTMFLTGTRARLDDQGRAEIPVTLYDRTIRLQRPLETALLIAAGRPIPSEIARILRVVEPALDIEPMLTAAAVTPRIVLDADTDVFAEALEFAATIGCDLFMSRDDRLTLRAVPSIGVNTQTVWRFSEAADALDEPYTSAIVSTETAMETDRIPNGIIVIGQHSSMQTPVRGEAWDERPSSVTYVGGEYGRYARRVPTEKATTIAQANAMARTILQAVNTATEVDVEVFPPPYHLVAGEDIVEVDAPSVGAEGRYILWSMTTPHGDLSAPAACTFRRAINEYDD